MIASAGGRLTQKDGTYRALDRILQSLERHTARQANRILNRQGSCWQAESHDYCARDENELERIIWYVIDNPVKAGLASAWESWPWTYAGMRADCQSAPQGETHCENSEL